MHFIKLGGDRYLIKDSHTIVNGKQKEELEKKDLESLVSGDIKETEPVIPRHNKPKKAKD
jgi:hypothetical protein